MTGCKEWLDPSVDQAYAPGHAQRADRYQRRAVLLGSAIATIAVASGTALSQAIPAAQLIPPQQVRRASPMHSIATRDGTRIHVKDWGAGQPVVFSHGWPLNADAWDEQMNFVASRGYRAIAHDRRGHGRSDQPWHGNNMDTYADDLAQVIEALDLRNIVLVGHSTGGGEVTRYMGRHGTGRVAKAVLAGAIPPLMLRTAANPGGQPREAFDVVRAGVLGDRSQFYRDLSGPFFGANREGSNVSQGMRDSFWLWSMQCGLRAAVECITAWSESDFTDDLKRIDVPTLILHGDDDQIVPIDNSARLTAQRLKRATLKVYRGGSHSLATTQQEQFNADLLAFIQA